MKHFGTSAPSAFCGDSHSRFPRACHHCFALWTRRFRPRNCRPRQRERPSWTIRRFSDGKIRSVPLLVQYDGRMYPQMGLMLASMMLGVSPRRFPLHRRHHHHSHERPTRRQRRCLDAATSTSQFSTYQSTHFHQPIATYFQIPWYGGPNWEAMYDPAHRAQKQHVSINAVHDICETRRRIENANRKMDGFLHAVFDTTTTIPPHRSFQHPPLRHSSPFHDGTLSRQPSRYLPG